MPLVGWLGRGTRRAHLPALIPAALTAYFTYAFLVVSRSGPFTVSTTWAPALNLSLSFRFDGLSILFAILIAAVGTLIVLYAAKYLEHHPQRGRFAVVLFAFMGAMLGLVLSDNLIALFVVWELTGFTS
jgi:multicomponent Na+:H+ antiporter subunit A